MSIVPQRDVAYAIYTIWYLHVSAIYLPYYINALKACSASNRLPQHNCKLARKTKQNNRFDNMKKVISVDALRELEFTLLTN